MVGNDDLQERTLEIHCARYAGTNMCLPCTMLLVSDWLLDREKDAIDFLPYWPMDGNQTCPFCERGSGR